MRETTDPAMPEDDITEPEQYKARCRMYEAWLKALDEYAVFDLWFKDNDSRYQFVNKRFEKSLGRRRQQLLGNSPHDFFSEDRANRIVSMDRMVREEGYIHRQVPCDESGVLQLHEEHRFVVTDHNNDPVGTGCIAFEITEQNMAQEALARAQKVGGIGIWRWSVHDKTLISCSEQFAEILGVGIAETYFLMRNRRERVVHEGDLPFVAEMLEKLTDPEFGSYGIEYRIIRPDGEARHVREVGEPLIGSNGSTVEYAGTLQDITEQKAIEEQLRRSNTMLESVVAERTRALEQTVSQLQEFAHVASHDLQEPLRKIEAFSDRLLSSCASKLNEREAYLIERMQNAASRMRNLVQDVLTHSMYGAQRDNKEPVDLNSIMSEIEDSLELQLQDKDARLEWSNLPTVSGNKSQIFRLFQNLISNAVKYSKPGVPPSVVVTSVCATGGQVEIAVEDNGTGFEPSYCEKIFGMFQRLHSGSNFEGTGVGLSTCRSIVQNHGGRIWASSEPGVGSCFHLTLPEPGHQPISVPHLAVSNTKAA